MLRPAWPSAYGIEISACARNAAEPTAKGGVGRTVGDAASGLSSALDFFGLFVRLGEIGRDAGWRGSLRVVGSSDDRAREGVCRCAFGERCGFQYLSGRPPLGAGNPCDCDLAQGDGSGLVKQCEIDARTALQGFSTLHEDSEGSRASDRNSDGHRGGESERTGTRNDQNGARRECGVEAAAAEHPRSEGRQRCECNDGRREEGRDTVGEPLDLRDAPPARVRGRLQVVPEPPTRARRESRGRSPHWR